MITSAQSRAARAFLNWTLDDLAKASGLSRTSLNTFEQGNSNAKAETYRQIRDAFERAGIEFTPEPGVRLRGQKLEVRRWEGENILEHLLDDIFQTCLNEGSEILISGLKEILPQNWSRDLKLMQRQIDRLRSHGITERVILEEGDDYFVFPPDITTYRWISPALFGLVPTITYGSKHAIIVDGPPLSIVVTENQHVAETYRRQFEMLWAGAQPVPFTNEKIDKICMRNLQLDVV